MRSTRRFRLEFGKKVGRAVDPHSLGSPGLSRRQLRRVSDFIEANLGEELTLAVLAEVARLSPWHFSRCFRRATGLTPHGYVTRRRMERAKVLLGSGGGSIAEIAIAVGFKSVASFTTCFGREVGVTAAQRSRLNTSARSVDGPNIEKE
jgi:AraC family transcriptional regulator